MSFGPRFRALRQRAASQQQRGRVRPAGDGDRTRAGTIGEIGEQRSDFSGRQSGLSVSSGHASARARRPASRCWRRAGYLRPTSASVAQAISFCFSAASDWPSRSSASGALAWLRVLGREVEERLAPRRRSAGAGTGFRRARTARPATQRSFGYFFRKAWKASSAQRVVLAQHVAVARGRSRPSATFDGGATAAHRAGGAEIARRRRRQHAVRCGDARLGARRLTASTDRAARPARGRPARRPAARP